MGATDVAAGPEAGGEASGAVLGEHGVKHFGDDALPGLGELTDGLDLLLKT